MTAAVDAERAVLGSLLLDRDAIADVATILPSAEMFAVPDHRAVYRAVLALWHRREPADLVTVSEQLRASGNDDVTSLDLANMMGAVPTAVHAMHYASRVRNAYRIRKMQEGYAGTLDTLSSNPDLDPVEALSGLIGTIMDHSGGELTGPRAYADLIDTVQERIDLEQAGAVERREIPTGFTDLDRTLNGGFKPGELVVVAARSSMGKTAFGYELIRSAARRGTAVMFSAEMTEDAIARRAIARESGVPLAVLDGGKMDPGQYDRFHRASEDMKALPIHVDDTSGITTDQVLVRTQRMQRHGPVGLVLFDYIELAGDRVGPREGEERRVAKIIHNLKHVALTCNVPVIALSQVSRDVETRKPFIPKLSDLRYSAAIEQTADKVLFLYRRDYYVAQGLLDYEAGTENTCQVIVAKHRNGPTGSVMLRYTGETFRFDNLQQERGYAWTA